MTSMIYTINGTGTNVFCRCELCMPDFMRVEMPDSSARNTIPQYYSEREAIDKGWRKTRHISICPPDRTYVWVCPDCAKERGMKDE